MNSSIHIKQLMQQVMDLDLDIPSAYIALTEDDARGRYNGVGPQDWSDKKRKALTEAFREYECCVFIHDICQSLKINADLSDSLLWSNLLKVWANKYGMFRWFKLSAWVERFKILPLLYKQLVENRDA